MFSIKYLEDENTLSSQIYSKINFPIRLFSLNNLGIDHNKFIDELTPTFSYLPWDYYDVRKKQFDFLKRIFPHHKKELDKVFPGYFQGYVSLEKSISLFHEISQSCMEYLFSLKPFRKRSIYYFDAHLESSNDWHIRNLPIGSFTQKTENDYRKLQRNFQEMSHFVSQHHLFKTLLQKICGIIKGIQPNIRKIRIVCHQVRIVANSSISLDQIPQE
ncbi:MAG: 2OG-Fe dioxygenase family protein [Spirochaetota bacterium]